MDARIYQDRAGRTEADQWKARNRMDGEASHCLPDCVPHRMIAAVRFTQAAAGIAKEGGELLSLLEKWVWYGQDLNIIKAKDELGDVLWYCAELCNAMGLDMGEVMAANLRKLKARYPDKFSEDQARDENRDRELELAALESVPTVPSDTSVAAVGEVAVPAPFQALPITPKPSCHAPASPNVTINLATGLHSSHQWASGTYCAMCGAPAISFQAFMPCTEQGDCAGGACSL